MDNFIFCLNATIPIFALMVLGIFFRKVNILKEQTIKEINGFVFKVSLPALLFQDLAGEDFAQAWDGGYVLFCFVVTCISITIAVLVSLLLKDKSYQGEFIQSSFRSSAALLGIDALINNLTPSIISPSSSLTNLSDSSINIRATFNSSIDAVKLALVTNGFLNMILFMVLHLPFIKEAAKLA